MITRHTIGEHADSLVVAMLSEDNVRDHQVTVRRYVEVYTERDFERLVAAVRRRLKPRGWKLAVSPRSEALAVREFRAYRADPKEREPRASA